MRLELADGTAIDDPDAAALERALLTLDGKGNNFAVLLQDDMTYIQAEGGPDRGFALEYQDGALDRHFECLNAPLSIGDVTAAFTGYLASDPAWRGRLGWQRLEL